MTLKYNVVRAQQHPLTIQNLADKQYVVQAVNAQLSRCMDQLTRDAEIMDPVYGELLATVQTLIERGGKRLRPLMTVWSYAGFGGQSTEAIIAAAASQELFHAGILMHDDIIDRDLTRWNGPNVSGIYLERFQQQPVTLPPRQLADSYALLAGDSCIDLSYRQLLESGFSDRSVMRALRLMHQTFFTMLGGELLDVHVSQLALTAVIPETLFNICSYKTASYSFSLPLEMGACLAGANESQLKIIRQLGSWLGLAYQLQDDLLGIFGDPSRTGKSVLSDVREGKRTLLMYHAYHRTDVAGTRILDQWLGNSKVQTKQLALIQRVIQESGAKQHLEAVIETCYAHVAELLPRIGWQPTYTDLFTHLYQSLIDRPA